LGAPLLRHGQTGAGAGGGLFLDGRRVKPLRHGREAVQEHGQRLLPGPRGVPVQRQGGLQARSGNQRCPRFLRDRVQPPPLLTRHHAQSLAQGVAQHMLGIFHPASAPPWAPVQRRPPLAGAKGTAGGRALDRPFQHTAVELPGDHPLTTGDQGACAEGRRVAVQTVQAPLPAAIHRGGLEHCVVRDLGVGLEQSGQRQLGGGPWGLALRVVLIERQQCLLKGIGKERRAVLPQEDKQLGPTDALDDGVFRRRQFDWGMPQRWTPGKPSCWNRKQMVVSHAITLWKNTRPVFYSAGHMN